MPKYSPPPPFSSPTLAPTFSVLFCAGFPPHPAHASVSGRGHRVAQQPRRVRLPRPRPCCGPCQVQLLTFLLPLLCGSYKFVTMCAVTLATTKKHSNGAEACVHSTPKRRRGANCAASETDLTESSFTTPPSRQPLPLLTRPLSPKRSTCCGMIAHRMSWFAAEHQRVCAGVKFFKDPTSPSGVLLQVSHKTAFVFVFFCLLASFLTLVAPLPPLFDPACCLPG